MTSKRLFGLAGVLGIASFVHFWWAIEAPSGEMGTFVGHGCLIALVAYIVCMFGAIKADEHK